MQGVRQHSWTVPILDNLVQGISFLPSSPGWTQGLSDLFDQVAPRVQVGTPPFLILAIKRDSSYVWASAEVQAKPMGFRAFTEAFRGVLVQLGEGSDAEDFTFNSLRRFMPTLANFLHLDPQQAQAVGHWQEVF